MLIPMLILTRILTRIPMLILCKIEHGAQSTEHATQETIDGWNDLDKRVNAHHQGLVPEGSSKRGLDLNERLCLGRVPNKRNNKL